MFVTRDSIDSSWKHFKLSPLLKSDPNRILMVYPKLKNALEKVFRPAWKPNLALPWCSLNFDKWRKESKTGERIIVLLAKLSSLSCSNQVFYIWNRSLSWNYWSKKKTLLSNNVYLIFLYCSYFEPGDVFRYDICTTRDEPCGTLGKFDLVYLFVMFSKLPTVFCFLLIAYSYATLKKTLITLNNNQVLSYQIAIEKSIF